MSAPAARQPPDRVVVTWCRACDRVHRVSLAEFGSTPEHCTCGAVVVRVRYQLTKRMGRLKRPQRAA